MGVHRRALELTTSTNSIVQVHEDGPITLLLKCCHFICWQSEAVNLVYWLAQVREKHQNLNVDV